MTGPSARTQLERTRRRPVRALVCVTALALALAGCDWAQIGFGPDHRYYNPYEPALTAATVDDLEVGWSQPCSCERVLVARGIAYVRDGSALRAFDAASGATRWSVLVGSNLDLVGIGNGLVYLVRRPAAGTHHLVARDASSGAHRFTFTPPSVEGQTVSIHDVVIDRGRAFFVAQRIGDPSTTVYAVDPAGEPIWATTPGGWGYRLVADPGRTVYVGTAITLTDPNELRGIPLLTALAQETGAIVSSVVVQTESPHAQEAYAFANGLVYTFSEFGHGIRGVGTLAVDPATGEVRWRQGFRPVVVGPGAVVGQSEAGWTAAHPVTGALLWSRADSESAGVAVGELLWRVDGSALAVQRLSDGGIVGTFSPGTEAIRDVVVADGRIFLATTTQLIALEPAS